MRTKILLPLFFFLFTFNIVLFHYMEGYSWVSSLYFVVVVLTTVGFGDIVPSNDFTRFLVTLLLIVGVLTFGFAIEDIIENVVNRNIEKIGAIPEKPLPYRGHIIIAGFGSKGRRIASVLRDRGFRVVVVESKNETAQLAIITGFETIIADISKQNILEVLSLHRSGGLFLTLSDDHTTIQTAIHIKALAPELEVYAEFRSSESYNIAKIAGVYNPVLYSSAIAAEIRSNLLNYEIFTYFEPKILTKQQASLGFVRAKSKSVILQHFKRPLPLGSYNLTLNLFEEDVMRNLEFYEEVSDKIEELFAVDRSELDNFEESIHSDITNMDLKIFVAGYTEISSDVIRQLDIRGRDITVFWKTEEQRQAAIRNGFQTIRWEIASCQDILEKHVTPGDIIISFFEDLTDALILAVTLKRLDRNQRLIQVVHYEQEIKSFIKAGASVVVSSQFAVTELILKEYFMDHNIPPSIILGNSQIFEMTIDNSIVRAKTIINTLLNGRRFRVLYIKKEDKEFEPYNPRKHRLEYGDRVLIKVKSVVKT